MYLDVKWVGVEIDENVILKYTYKGEKLHLQVSNEIVEWDFWLLAANIKHKFIQLLSLIPSLLFADIIFLLFLFLWYFNVRTLNNLNIQNKICQE